VTCIISTTDRVGCKPSDINSGSVFAEVSKVAADPWLACEVEDDMDILYKRDDGWKPE
jgi:hypothetical protein